MNDERIECYSPNMMNKSDDEKKVRTNASNMNTLNIDFEPSPNHVICARGREAKEWQGNKFLRSLVDASVPKYEAATNRMEKTVIVSEIIEAVRSQTRDGVAFVKKVNNQWYQINESLSREKVGQLLRERLHQKYKSSTKAKRRKQREMNETASCRLNEAARASPTIASSINHLSESIVSLPSASDANFETALTAANVAILGQLKTDMALNNTNNQNNELRTSQQGPYDQSEAEERMMAATAATEEDTSYDVYDFIPKDFPFLDDDESPSAL